MNLRVFSFATRYDPQTAFIHPGVLETREAAVAYEFNRGDSRITFDYEGDPRKLAGVLNYIHANLPGLSLNRDESTLGTITSWTGAKAYLRQAISAVSFLDDHLTVNASGTYRDESKSFEMTITDTTVTLRTNDRVPCNTFYDALLKGAQRIAL